MQIKSYILRDYLTNAEYMIFQKAVTGSVFSLVSMEKGEKYLKLGQTKVKLSDFQKYSIDEQIGALVEIQNAPTLLADLNSSAMKVLETLVQSPPFDDKLIDAITAAEMQKYVLKLFNETQKAISELQKKS